MSKYQKWEKLGLIFDPKNTGLDWMRTHAQNPMPEALGGGIYKAYFATRDAQNRSRGGYFVFDIRRPFEVLDYSRDPLIDLGPLGCFDDSGVMPSGLADYGGRRYLYYTGWTKAVDTPFAFHIGLVISNDGGTSYARPHLAPVLGRNPHDPYITGAPFVLLENGLFRMWYISGTKWERIADEKPKHFYTIKYAESQDGMTWRTNAELCLAYEAQEYAIARPIVRRLSDGYEMWFTFRGGSKTYRLGFATSSDGRRWTRNPSTIGIDVSPAGWDSEMICYGHPFEHDGRLYSLYNGNSYGATGAGLAVVTD